MHINERIKDVWEKQEKALGHRLNIEFRREVEELMPGYNKEVYLEDLNAMIPSYVKLAMALKLPDSGKKDSAPTTSKGKNQKYFERRVYIADFILSRIYTPSELFIPLYENTPMPKRHIEWEGIITEWNETNPSDQMKWPALKSAFYKAIKEDVVLQEILAREFRDTESFLESLKQFREAYSLIKLKLAELAKNIKDTDSLIMHMIRIGSGELK
ncbi:hypothetical protein ACFLUD_01930 [Chloroflexota bacterium]